MSTTFDRHLRAACAAAVIAAATIGPAQAQEESADLDADTVARVHQASPQATKKLPRQPEDTGQLMPLHAASVLGWVCADPAVQAALAEGKPGCYRAIYPLIATCTAQLQAKAPAAQNKLDNGRLDVVSFRAAFRQCLLGQYAEQQKTLGRTTTVTSDLKGMQDPLAARMGGASSK